MSLFKSEMTLARRLLDTVLHPTDGEPILAALLDAEIAHDRQAHEAAEALTREVERRREAEAELRFARELFEDLLSVEIGNCTTNLRAPDQAARRAAVPDDDQGDIPIFEDVIARIDKVLGDATDTPVDRQGGAPDA